MNSSGGQPLVEASHPGDGDEHFKPLAWGLVARLCG